MSDSPTAASQHNYYSPAAERNRQPILAVLQEILTPRTAGRVLEIASGSGQHIEFFAPHFSAWQWLPSEANANALTAIRARTQHLHNVGVPQLLDVCAAWPPLQVQAVLVANLFHISAAPTVSGFFRGAAEVMSDGGLVHVYGPFKRAGEFTSPGNRNFDLDLRQRNAEWGIRDLEAVQQIAADCGFGQCVVRDMPAHNLSVSWQTG